MPRPLRALIIEDEPLIQSIITRLLTRMFDTPSYIVVNNADRAIKEINDSFFDGYFDLIISDYNLIGKKTGMDVFAWIKEREPDMLNRFLFFSGTTDVKLEEFHNHVLKKPADLITLQKHILAITSAR